MTTKQKISQFINTHKLQFIRLGATVSIVLIAVVIAFINTKTKDEPETKPPAVKQINVVAQKFSPAAHSPVLKSTSTVDAWQESQLAAQVGGRLEWLCDCLEIGNVIKKDTVLARIEAVDYQVAVAQAKQALADARQLIAEEEARSEQARADWSDLNLGEPSNLALRKPQLEAAYATLNRRQLELQQTNRNLKRTQIKAPYDGVITSRTTNVGNFVTTGSSIGKILNTDKVHINLALKATDINKIDPENTAITLRQKGADNLTWQAKLARVDSMIDSKTRLINVIAEVEHPFDLEKHTSPLRVGSFVSAEFSGTPIDNTYAVLGSAVLTDNSIFVVNADNTLSKLDVSIVHRNPTEVLIKVLDNTKDTLNIVTEGQAALASGLSVNILASDTSEKPDLASASN